MSKRGEQNLLVIFIFFLVATSQVHLAIEADETLKIYRLSFNYHVFGICFATCSMHQISI